jgi:hypothetical protein
MPAVPAGLTTPKKRKTTAITPLAALCASPRALTYFN